MLGPPKNRCRVRSFDPIHVEVERSNKMNTSQKLNIPSIALQTGKKCHSATDLMTRMERTDFSEANSEGSERVIETVYGGSSVEIKETACGHNYVDITSDQLKASSNQLSVSSVSDDSINNVCDWSQCQHLP